jgi:hypothetical protein
MLIEVLETTGHVFEGIRFDMPSIGDKLVLGDCSWDVVDIVDNRDGTFTLVDPNFIAIVREVKE